MVQELYGQISNQLLTFTIYNLQVDVISSQSLRFHVLRELYLSSVLISLGALDFRIDILNHTNIDFQLWRRHRQPVRICGLVTFLLELNLPFTFWYVPTVHAILVSNLWVYLLIVLGIPNYDVLMRVAIDIRHIFSVVAGSGHTLQTIALQTLIHKARGVVHTFYIGII